jgi:hypothetical protein
MNTSEQKKYISEKFNSQFLKIIQNIEMQEFRDIEAIIDDVNDNIFTRYCITLLLDELISYNQENLSDDE